MAKSSFFILKSWLPVFFYAYIIFYLSSITILPPAPRIPFADKFFHILEYTILGYLLSCALTQTTKIESKSKFIFLVVLITLFYGITDELHQLFVSNRVASFSDVIADAIGGLIGAKFYR